MKATAGASVRVQLVFSPAAEQVELIELELAPGSSVGQALRASGWLEHHPLMSLQTLQVGIWGRRCGLDECLHEGDRIEIYRPLRIDPKEARRLRQRKQPAKRRAR